MFHDLAMTSARRTPQHQAHISAIADLTPRMRRITVQGESLREVQPNPAQDAEVILTEASGRKLRRRYTIRHARPGLGEWDLDVLRHGHGPGSSWAEQAQPGQSVDFFGPRGRLVLSAVDWHLFVGDESALPAIAALTELVPTGQHAIAIVEVTDRDDELDLSSDVRWCHRGPLRPGTPDLLAPAITALTTPAGRGHAYLLGESRTVVSLRTAVAEHGLGVPDCFVKGYWNHARPR
jgi:NADPH-dependent ferric siderophore reductase